MKDLGLQLRKNKDNADTALQLLKILDTKKITAELLIATLIGKALSSVNDTVEEGRDVEKLKELTKMKEHLKSKWKKVNPTGGVPVVVAKASPGVMVPMLEQPLSLSSMSLKDRVHSTCVLAR